MNPMVQSVKQSPNKQTQVKRNMARSDSYVDSSIECTCCMIYLVGAQPSPCCSFARHLVGKIVIHCAFAHH